MTCLLLWVEDQAASKALVIINTSRLLNTNLLFKAFFLNREKRFQKQ